MLSLFISPFAFESTNEFAIICVPLFEIYSFARFPFPKRTNVFSISVFIALLIKFVFELYRPMFFMIAFSVFLVYNTAGM